MANNSQPSQTTILINNPLKNNSNIIIPVTSLSTYLFCKRKLFLEKVLKIFVPVKEAVILGSIRHYCYEKINKIEETLVKSINQGETLEQIETRYNTMYSAILKQTLIENKHELKRFNISLVDQHNKIFPLLKNESKLRAANLFNFINEKNFYGQELWDNLTPKLQSEVSITSKTLGMRGIIDQIEIYPNLVAPIELKTGKTPATGIWPNHRTQVSAYMLLLEDVYKQPIPKGYVYYLDTLDRRQIISNPFLKDEVLALRDKVIETITSKELPDFLDNKNKCNSCDLKEKCYNKEFMEQRVQEVFAQKVNVSS